MGDILTKDEAKIIELLFKSAESIKMLEHDIQYLKARAFDLISSAEMRNTPSTYDPYPLREECRKMATYLSMKNQGQPCKEPKP